MVAVRALRLVRVEGPAVRGRLLGKIWGGPWVLDMMTLGRVQGVVGSEVSGWDENWALVKEVVRVL